METIQRSFDGRNGVHSNAFAAALTCDQVAAAAPAVFASAPHARTSASYTFISTQQLLQAFEHAGFAPVEVRQTRSRQANALHAAHLVRLRRRYESVQLKDAIPEIVFLNSHDGRTAYQLRFGLFRAVCTNGMIVSSGSFGEVRVTHRHAVIDDIIRGALEMSERFCDLGVQVQAMEARQLDDTERVHFAERALALRYPDVNCSGLHPSQLLACRRLEDDGRDLWHTYNVVQENLLRGGASRRSQSGRLTRLRRITSIRVDVALNTALWDLASETLSH